MKLELIAIFVAVFFIFAYLGFDLYRTSTKRKRKAMEVREAKYRREWKNFCDRQDGDLGEYLLENNSAMSDMLDQQRSQFAIINALMAQQQAAQLQAIESQSLADRTAYSNKMAEINRECNPQPKYHQGFQEALSNASRVRDVPQELINPANWQFSSAPGCQEPGFVYPSNNCSNSESSSTSSSSSCSSDSSGASSSSNSGSCGGE